MPKATSIWIAAWKKMKGWFGTPSAVSVQSFAARLSLPLAWIEAAPPVESGPAAQSWIPTGW